MLCRYPLTVPVFACWQVKLFVELFTNKFQSLTYKLLRGGSKEELAQLTQDFEHNLEVRPLPCLTWLLGLWQALTGFSRLENGCGR